MKQVFFILIVFFSLLSKSQTKKIDSLKLALSFSKIDTLKVNCFIALAAEFKNTNPDTSLFYAKKALELSQKIKFDLGEADSYFWIGTAYFNFGKNEDAILMLTRAKIIIDQLCIVNKKEIKRIKKSAAKICNTIGNVYSSSGNYQQALKNHQEALKIRQILHDKVGISASFNNIALIYSRQGNYSEALKNHFKSLKIKELLNNKEGMAVSYNNIGLIYKDQGNNNQALKHLRSSLSAAKEVGLLNIISTCHLNIGAIYVDQKKYKEGLENLIESYNIAKEIESKEDISNALGTIGQLYFVQGKYSEALENLFSALKLKEELEDNSGISSFLNSIGEVYLKKGDFKNAIFYGEKSLQYARKTNNLLLIQQSSYSLIGGYKTSGNFKNALEMQQLYFASRDSILSDKNQKESLRNEFQYNYEKQSLSDSLNYVNEKKISELANLSQLNIEKNKRITLYVGLVFLILLIAFVFNRFRITKQQKNTIELQTKKLEITHHELEEKTKEIKDSILYSKEIQNTFLKSPTNSKTYFQDTFLYYRPKDIVSGDFYWYKEIDNELFIVVGDCTGHGVPGAIISVLAIQSLEKTITKIDNHNNLHQLNEFMKNEFNVYYNAGGHVSIGLDYSIICLNSKENKVYITGSGATVLVKDNDNNLKAEKFDTINIGGSAPAIYEPKTSVYDFKSVQSVFLFTDGVIDQKGEETGKKFGTKKLKDMILNLNTNDSSVAIKIIENEMTKWIGNTEQIDDITLLGIQINQS